MFERSICEIENFEKDVEPSERSEKPFKSKKIKKQIIELFDIVKIKGKHLNYINSGKSYKKSLMQRKDVSWMSSLSFYNVIESFVFGMVGWIPMVIVLDLVSRLFGSGLITSSISPVIIIALSYFTACLAMLIGVVIKDRRHISSELDDLYERIDGYQDILKDCNIQIKSNLDKLSKKMNTKQSELEIIKAFYKVRDDELNSRVERALEKEFEKVNILSNDFKHVPENLSIEAIDKVVLDEMLSSLR